MTAKGKYLIVLYEGSTPSRGKWYDGRCKVGKSPRGPARQWVNFNELKKLKFCCLITHWRSYRNLAIASTNLRTFRRRLGKFPPFSVPFLLSSLSSFLLPLYFPHVEKNRPQLSRLSPTVHPYSFIIYADIHTHPYTWIPTHTSFTHSNQHNTHTNGDKCMRTLPCLSLLCLPLPFSHYIFALCTPNPS